MGTKRKPTLEEAGRFLFDFEVKVIGDRVTGVPLKIFDELSIDAKKKYTKLAIEVWRKVEKCI